MTFELNPTPDWNALRREAGALAATTSDPLAKSFVARMLAALDHYGIRSPEVGPDGRKGQWNWCHMGGRFYPLDPRPEEVHLADIVWSLSHQNRYGGHTRRPYSVLTHVMLAQDIARWLARGGDTHFQFPRVSTPEELEVVEQDALMHDSTETYVDDVRNPLKPYLWSYGPIEYGVAQAIGHRFGMGNRLAEPSEIVRLADRLAVAVEARELCDDPKDWGLPPPPPFETANETPVQARRRFLARYAALFPRHPADIPYLDLVG